MKNVNVKNHRVSVKRKALVTGNCQNCEQCIDANVGFYCILFNNQLKTDYGTDNPKQDPDCITLLRDGRVTNPVDSMEATLCE